MAINPPSISSVDYSESFDAQIRVTRDKPNTFITLNPPEKVQMLVGYYDVANDRMQLYITNDTGTRYLRIG